MMCDVENSGEIENFLDILIAKRVKKVYLDGDSISGFEFFDPLPSQITLQNVEVKLDKDSTTHEKFTDELEASAYLDG